MENCVVIQTCDAYSHYWSGLSYSMEKYWDFSIPWDIYLCNEETKISFENKKFHQITTGTKNYADRLLHILENLNCDYIFYMLEDFWPTDRMTKHIFTGLFNKIQENEWDCLRVSPYMPEYYDLESTNHIFDGKMILKYSDKSHWKFSQQASFWNRKFLMNIIEKSLKTEIIDSTSLPFEIACDEYLRDKKVNIYHYHYFWYPISGVVWRGKLTQIGEQIEAIMNIESIMQNKFYNLI